VRERVERAFERQRARQPRPNGRLTPGEVDVHCRTDADAEVLLVRAARRLGLSARAFHRLRKVARTIADLAGAPTISAAHMAEAIGYRRLDGVPAPVAAARSALTSAAH
jgi:magnesium chelatase family protein